MTQPRSSPRPNASTEEAVAFLRCRTAYPDAPAHVEVRETHMSWVFLTEHTVYKLKKPVRSSYLDYATPAARRANCQAEVRLNRRLAPLVYLEVVALVRTPDRALRLGGPGVPVDWLVKMRRLPTNGLLDQAIAAGGLAPPRLAAAADLLARFYRDCPKLRRHPAAHASALAAAAQDNHAAIRAMGEALPAARVDAVLAALTGFVQREGELLAERGRRLVEGHGDLRPDHIYLGPPAAVIDCIEFNREFRINDPVDELSFLAMECDRLRQGWIGDMFMATYARCTGDTPPARLPAFYRAHRAVLRAKLALWHLRDDPSDPRAWRAKALDYLRLAEGYLGLPG